MKKKEKQYFRELLNKKYFFFFFLNGLNIFSIEIGNLIVNSLNILKEEFFLSTFLQKKMQIFIKSIQGEKSFYFKLIYNF